MTKIDYGRDLEDEENQAKKAEKAKKKAEKQAAKAAAKGKDPDKDTAADAAKDSNKDSDKADESFFVFNLGGGKLVKGGFQQNVTSLNMAGHQLETEVEITQKGSPNNTSTTTKIDKDVFTRDGYAQLENATFQFKTDSDKASSISGKGKFRFQSIPYRIRLSDGSFLTGNTQKKDDPEEDDAEFTINPSGDLDAEVGDGVELSLLKGGNSTEAIINSIVLDGVSVERGYLKAKSLRLYQGANVGFNLDDVTKNETIKNLFSVDVAVSAAHITPEDRSPTISSVGGITADTTTENKKAHAGRFALSNFLGYLSAAVDYPAGKIDAELSHEGEKEVEGKSLTKLFEKKSNGVNVEVPIVPFINFSLGVAPNVNYGGSLDAHLDRHKSFGEKLDVGENMDLAGAFKLGGSVGVTLSAGVSAGVPYIVSAGVALEGSASAGVELNTEAKTSIAKQENKKFGQSAPLSVEGSLAVTLNLGLKFCGTVGLLIWKANVFELDIADKKIELDPLKFALSKQPNSGGVLSGWNFDGISLSAEAFGKEAQLAVQREIKDENPLYKAKEELAASQEAVDVLGTDVEDTWKALEDMKANQSNHGYVIEPEDKARLEQRIAALTETAEEKLKNQEAALTAHLIVLENVKDLSKAELDKTKTALEECQRRNDMWKNLSDLADTGGFSGAAQYQTIDTTNLKGKEKRAAEAANQETNAKAMVDLNISTILGTYDLTFDAAKKEVVKRLEEYNEPIKDPLFRRELPVDLSTISLKDFEKQSFHGVFNDKFEYTGLAMLQHLTKIQNNHNYYDVLSQPVLAELAQSDADSVRKNFGENYRKVFRKKLNPDDPNSKETYFDTKMTGYEFLQCVLSNKYPKGAVSKEGIDRSGQDIEGTTAAEKQKALNALVHDYNADVYAQTGGLAVAGSNMSAETAVHQGFTHLAATVFGMTPEALAKSKSFDLNKEVEALTTKVTDAQKKHTAAEAEYKKASNAVEKCNTEIEQCRTRLAQLAVNVSGAAQVNQTGAAEKAAAAVDYIQKDHKKVDALTTSVNKIVKGESVDSFKKLKGVSFLKQPVAKQ